METIKFNVRDRGRMHRGKERNFDTRALAALVNSPETQERVRNRDMVGYYGHWQRMKFGMIPPETVITAKGIINIEPAIVTTYLRAEPDGTIEHRTEFLDTAAGKIAARLHRSKTGGFSSAINARPRNGQDVAELFAGFDYVLEPNYTTNRGYLFDGVMDPDDLGDEAAIFDFVMQDRQNNAAMVAMYDSLYKDHERAMATIERLMEDNEDLLSELARGRAGTVLLDSVDPGQRPTLLSKGATTAFAAHVAGFKHATLARFEEPPEASEAQAQASPILDTAMEKWGISA